MPARWKPIPNGLLEGTGSPDLRERDTPDSDGTPRLVNVKGHIEADWWADTNEWPRDHWYSVPVPDDPEWRGKRLVGVEVRGCATQETYCDGQVVIYIDGLEAETGVVPGKRYIVEKQRGDGLRETTVKKLWRDSDGDFWLLTDSSDPDFGKALAWGESAEDSIVLKGRVVYSVRRE